MPDRFQPAGPVGLLEHAQTALVVDTTVTGLVILLRTRPGPGLRAAGLQLPERLVPGRPQQPGRPPPEPPPRPAPPPATGARSTHPDGPPPPPPAHPTTQPRCPPTPGRAQAHPGLRRHPRPRRPGPITPPRLGLHHPGQHQHLRRRRQPLDPGQHPHRGRRLTRRKRRGIQRRHHLTQPIAQLLEHRHGSHPSARPPQGPPGPISEREHPTEHPFEPTTLSPGTPISPPTSAFWRALPVGGSTGSGGSVSRVTPRSPGCRSRTIHAVDRSRMRIAGAVAVVVTCLLAWAGIALGVLAPALGGPLATPPPTPRRATPVG